MFSPNQNFSKTSHRTKEKKQKQNCKNGCLLLGTLHFTHFSAYPLFFIQPERISQKQP